jgi:hypothetical protein
MDLQPAWSLYSWITVPPATSRNRNDDVPQSQLKNSLLLPADIPERPSQNRFQPGRKE